MRKSGSWRCFRGGDVKERGDGECLQIGQDSPLFKIPFTCADRWNARGGLRVSAEGKILVVADCQLDQEMPKGTMCWLQGASGVVYADRYILGLDRKRR